MLNYTYKKAGVDRKLRERAKKILKGFDLTFRYSRQGKIIKTPFNNLYPVGKGIYQVKTADGVGTKILLAELANSHGTIGIDAVAMVVNDCIRCGAVPLALTNIIDTKKTTPKLIMEIKKGLIKGAKEAGCPIVGGETADVPELLNCPYQLNCDCVGEVKKEDIISGEKIKPGDIVLGFRSAGVHSNGFTLLRKVLFKRWSGKYDAFDRPGGIKRPLVLECLKPTRIYVKPFLKLREKFEILGAVHITGDAYLKFKRLNPKVGFEFFNFRPQLIFGLIQEAGGISDKEMFKTFNMGWGFAVVVRKKEADKILSLARHLKLGLEIIGQVIKERKIIIRYQNKRIVL